MLSSNSLSNFTWQDDMGAMNVIAVPFWNLHDINDSLYDLSCSLWLSLRAIIGHFHFVTLSFYFVDFDKENQKQQKVISRVRFSSSRHSLKERIWFFLISACILKGNCFSLGKHVFLCLFLFMLWKLFSGTYGVFWGDTGYRINFSDQYGLLFTSMH